MKKLLLIITFLSVVIFANAQCDCTDEATTGVPQAECEALMALYNSTNGAGWDYSDNWNTASNVFSWYGVIVEGGHVTKLFLYENKLSGSIPKEIGNLTELKKLYLQENKLSGSIPKEIGNLTKLQHLYLYKNNLSGSMPKKIGDLSELKILNLRENQLSGSIPPEIGDLTKLEKLYLYKNNLSGSIPAAIGNLTKLEKLYLYKNNLSGSIPKEIGDLSKLEFLYLQENQLSGSIPPEIGNLTELYDLYLNNNNLSGSIPKEIGDLSKLEFLYLQENQLSGSIPKEIGKLSELYDLHLNNNNLSGSVPKEIGDLRKLRYLRLENNNFTSLPVEMRNLTNILDKELYIDNNMIQVSDRDLLAYLNDKANNPNWRDTQRNNSNLEFENNKFLGYVEVGGNTTFSYTIKNSGSEVLKIGEVKINAPFEIVSFTPSTAVGDAGVIKIKYSPTAVKDKDEGTMVVTYNGQNSPANITFSGIPTENKYDIVLNGKRLELGEINILEDAIAGSTKVFEIRNGFNKNIILKVNEVEKEIPAGGKLKIEQITKPEKNKIVFKYIRTRGSGTTTVLWTGTVPPIPLNNWGIYLFVFLAIGFVVIRSRIS